SAAGAGPVAQAAGGSCAGQDRVRRLSFDLTRSRRDRQSLGVRFRAQRQIQDRARTSPADQLISSQPAEYVHGEAHGKNAARCVPAGATGVSAGLPSTRTLSSWTTARSAIA